jgi:hypothetical protein
LSWGGVSLCCLPVMGAFPEERALDEMIGAECCAKNGEDQEAKACPRMSIKKAKCCEELNNRKVKDVGTIGKVPVFSPVTQVWQKEGKR